MIFVRGARQDFDDWREAGYRHFRDNEAPAETFADDAEPAAAPEQIAGRRGQRPSAAARRSCEAESRER